MKRFFLLILLTVSTLLQAQTTRVTGRVSDAVTGEAVAYAAVFFQGTEIGVSTGADGLFSLETDALEGEKAVLCCQLVGYDPAEAEVGTGMLTRVNFFISRSDTRLSGAKVKADNSRARALLDGIEEHRAQNDPESRPYYSTEAYSKLELGICNPFELLYDRKFMEEFGFVFDYLETSGVTGFPYIPMLLSESVSERRHSLSPASDSETVTANRISGVNPENNLLSQFSGSMHLKVNFYRPFINAFDVEIPSPIQSAGMLYYNYYIVDSLQVDGRKTWLVHYHPKSGISTPAFDGEMQVDAEDFALRSIHASLPRRSNVNWLRGLTVDAVYRRLPDSTWFYGNEDLSAEFAFSKADTLRTMSVLGTRSVSYSVPDCSAFEMTGPEALVTVAPDAGGKDEGYWTAVRPTALSPREENIFTMVDRVQQSRYYDNIYDLASTLVNGYWDIGRVGIGPYNELVSFNDLEGLRLQLGVRTSSDWSTKQRWSAYAAYGFGDRTPKGGVKWERLFSKEPTRKLTLDAHYDVVQLGRGGTSWSDASLLSSVFSRRGSRSLSPMSSFSAMYEHEVCSNLNLQADASLKRYYANAFVPLVTLDGTPLASVASNELHLMARFSKDETVNRGRFVKTYVHSAYPVLTFDLTGGIGGLRPGDVSFLRPELTLDWKLRMPPVGVSRIHANAGTIMGEVPYPLLHLHEGNTTSIFDMDSFSCMEYFEFASDSWATLFWNHSFNGFFLGKIPLVRRLDLREEFTFRAAYGSLSDRNNPLRAGAPGSAVAFLPVTGSLEGIPYVELGAGISNIFRILRVDCIWRMTHRDTAVRNFAVNWGLELKF